MNVNQFADVSAVFDEVQTLLEEKDFAQIADIVSETRFDLLIELLERLPEKERAIVYRFLPKDRAVDVFERLSPALQSDLVDGLQDSEVATIFTDLDPEDRVWLLDELPSSLAVRLLQGLSERERQLTSEVLGYPKGSVGRRMSPEYVSTRDSYSVAITMQRLQQRLDDVENVYALPVLDDQRRVVGIVGIRDLLRANPDQLVSEIMGRAQSASAYQTAESAARKCADLRVLMVPVTDRESRLVGVLTLDDAVRILEMEETEDSARQGGVEPLRRPYLATPIRKLVGSRIIWLLVLAIGATLTVQVMSLFEETIQQVTVLALFVPLLIGTGGNTGNQAATTLTRALALGDVKTGDLAIVLLRELRVGFALGALLGATGGLITGLIFDPRIGLVICLTLIALCTMAATVGGIMPLIARTLRVDPAVFSNPFITTFTDATGLVIYFLIARTILGI